VEGLAKERANLKQIPGPLLAIHRIIAFSEAYVFACPTGHVLGGDA